jgi:hypothetical protein
MIWVLIAICLILPGLILFYGGINENFREQKLRIFINYQRDRFGSLKKHFGLLGGGVFLVLAGALMFIYAVESGRLDTFFGARGTTQIVDQ